MGQGLPSTTVMAPSPSSTKRSALIEWRCGFADSPGSSIWIAAERFLVVASSSAEREAGFTSDNTRRSTTAGEVTAMACASNGRNAAQDQRCASAGGGGGLCAVGLSQSGTRCAAFHAWRTDSRSGAACWSDILHAPLVRHRDPSGGRDARSWLIRHNTDGFLTLSARSAMVKRLTP